MNGNGNGTTLAKQIESFVAAGGISAIVMALASAYKAWVASKPAPLPSVASPSPLEAENADLKRRLAELEKKEQK